MLLVILKGKTIQLSLSLTIIRSEIYAAFHYR